MNKKVFEISKPQETILKSVKQRTLFLSGVGSGKSHVAGLVSAEYILNFPQIRGFIGANTYGQLSKSTLNRIFDVWQNSYGWYEGRDYVIDKQPPKSFKRYGSKLKSYENVISFDNGHTIFVASLDNYKVIDGTEFAYAILDETKDTKEQAVKEVIIARLRQKGMWTSGNSIYSEADIETYKKHKLVQEKVIDGKKILWNNVQDCQVKGFNPMYVLTSPAKVEWLNQWFEVDQHLEEINSKIFSKVDFYHANHGENISVTISSTYHNETNLSLGYIDGLVDAYKHNPSLVDMLIYGSPIAKSGGEWFSRFERDKHVRECEFDPNFPIHISLDFNVVPYMTLLVSQFVPNERGNIEWRTLKEYCLKNPKNNTEDACLEFLYDYGSKIKNLFYTGDPSGRNRSTSSRSERNDFAVVERVLKRYIGNYSDMVLRGHPSLASCRDFFNRMLSDGFRIEVVIDPSCKNLINDMEFLMEDINGAYKKPKVKDSVTGESYEKLGHCADAWRYQGVAAFQEEFNE